MKKTALNLILCVVVLAIAAPGIVAGEEKSSKELERDAKRAKINEVAQETLQQLFAEKPNAKELYDEAVGWAVFDNTKVAFGISGGGGTGVAVSKASGKHVYMKMGTGGVGFGLGVNKFQVVFLFQNEEAKTNFVNGLAIYQLTEKGLMLNADLAGTKYWLHDKLNE
jgi:lipid-binding SYLF domain-containing protein